MRLGAIVLTASFLSVIAATSRAGEPRTLELPAPELRPIRTVPPPSDELVYYRKPEAYKSQPGSLCRNLHAFARPPDETGPTRLSFAVSYAASGRDGRLDGCEVSEEIEVALPAGRTLEERIAGVFANRTVRLRDLSSITGSTHR